MILYGQIPGSGNFALLEHGSMAAGFDSWGEYVGEVNVAQYSLGVFKPHNVISIISSRRSLRASATEVEGLCNILLPSAFLPQEAFVTLQMSGEAVRMFHRNPVQAADVSGRMYLGEQWLLVLRAEVDMRVACSRIGINV